MVMAAYSASQDRRPGFEGIRKPKISRLEPYYGEECCKARDAVEMLDDQAEVLIK